MLYMNPVKMAGKCVMLAIPLLTRPVFATPILASPNTSSSLDCLLLQSSTGMASTTTADSQGPLVSTSFNVLATGLPSSSLISNQNSSTIVSTNGIHIGTNATMGETISDLAATTPSQDSKSTTTLNGSIHNNSTAASGTTTVDNRTKTKPCEATNSLIFECKSCDDPYINIHSPVEPDPMAAWQAADANNALEYSLDWWNAAKNGEDADCLTQNPTWDNCTEDLLPNDISYVQGIQTLWQSKATESCMMTDSSCTALDCSHDESKFSSNIAQRGY